MHSSDIVGKTIAHYQILEALASGGMASVYKAVDLQLDRTVVLKVLDSDLLGDTGARRRFLREARLASSLDHPNICTIYEIHEEQGIYYIAMQFVQGQTLKRSIAGRPLANSALLSVALQVADAVATAHDRGIIHRDIKPQNIMITPRGQAKVLDFGLGKNLEDTGSHGAADLTVLGSPFGTPSYMSPEQARGERADRRADVFSFGIVLYEMATGRKPFTGKNQVEVLYAICNEIPAPISDYNPEAAAGLQEVCAHALAKDPADRFQSMHEVLEALKSIAGAFEAGQEVPDGIGTPFHPVESVRIPWYHRLLPAFLRRSHQSLALEAPSEVQPENVSRTTSITPTDDFPIIPGMHKTLAVLPFRSLGESVDTQWGLSVVEALITELAKFKSVTVRPLSYVTKYADPQINPTLAGRELGTDGVLHGSLLRADQKLRVTAQLIDTKAGGVLWAGKFDLTFEDSIGVVDTVCQCILRGLSGRQRTGPLELLQDHDEEIRLDGVQSLRYSHDPRAAELLARTLADPNIRIRAAAAEALGQLGKTAAPIVASCIEDATDQGDYMTARFAAKAAGLIGSAEALAPLLDALSNEDSLLASEAALALGNLSDERALPDLLDALVRDDANVRFTAAQALGTLEHPGALEALEARIREDEDEGVRAKAQWAATRIRRRLERDDTGVPSSWPARDLVESESLR